LTVTASNLADLLATLPPSKEVLEAYKTRVLALERDERRWAARLRAWRGAASKAADLEAQLERKESELRATRSANAQMQEAVAAERKRAASARAENDRLKVRREEDARKIAALLRMAGKKEEELERFLRAADDQGGGDGRAASVVSDQLREHLKHVKRRRPAAPATIDSLRLEVASLETQLIEQERCHAEQVSSLENERRSFSRQLDEAFRRHEEKTEELAQ